MLMDKMGDIAKIMTKEQVKQYLLQLFIATK